MVDAVSEPENVIQSACADALAVFFDRENVTYRQLWTYANQQGDEPNKFCGDLVGIIDNAALLLLEFKALDHSTSALSAFNSDQFEEAKRMEAAGIPLVYCYDFKKPLPYILDPRSDNWPLETLQAVKVSKPSILPSSTPAIRAHGTLYDWIDNAKKSEGTSCLSAFGKIVGGILPNNMRNGLLTVLFSEKQKIAFELDQHGLNQFYHWLIKNPRASSPEQLARIAKLMVEVDSRVKMEKNVKPSVVKGKKKGFKM